MKLKSKTIKNELKYIYPNHTPDEIEQLDTIIEKYCFIFGYGFFFGVTLILFCFIGLTLLTKKYHEIPQITIVSVDFTAKLKNNNISIMQKHHHNQLSLISGRWDLLIRVPGKLVGNGNDICLQGNLQSSFLYKNATLATSSTQSYKLQLNTPQVLNVSAVATKEYLSGAIGKEIMDAFNERSELRFGSRLSLTDCREETKRGTMSYECDEANLRFERSNSDHIIATAFGNHPTCVFSI